MKKLVKESLNEEQSEKGISSLESFKKQVRQIIVDSWEESNADYTMEKFNDEIEKGYEDYLTPEEVVDKISEES